MNPNSDIEWWEPGTSGVYTGHVAGLAEARGLTVGHDEVLVVVFPTVRPDVLHAHAARLREVLGNRFILVSGDDVQLAKIKKDQWAVGSHDD